MAKSDKKKSRKAPSVKADAPVRQAPPRKRNKLTNARLRQVAAKHRPPQSWYENCPVNGLFVAIESESTDTIEPIFEGTK